MKSRCACPSGVSVGTAAVPALHYDTTWHYASHGRFGRVQVPGLPAFGAEYGYLADSRRVETVSYKADVSTILAGSAYQALPNRNLVETVVNTAGATTVSQYAYHYDCFGQRTSVNYSGTAFNQPMHHAFGYNDRREVNLARQFEGTSKQGPEILPRKREYGFDNIGNRVTHTVGGGSPVSYTPNQLNQYSQSGEGAHAYDFDGNLTWTVGANLEWYYHWDGENRLREVDNSLQQTATFTYDYRGRRVRAVIFTQADLIEERYVWDDWNLLLVLDANNNPVQKFTWGLDIAEQARGLPWGGRPGAAAGGVGGLLGASMSQGGGAVDHLFFYDGNGNVGQLLDWASGQTVAHYEYDPFGNIVASSGSRAAANRFRFSTKYQDELTELYYYGYRYYSSSMGRWLNRDPIEEQGGLNLFGFVQNDPLMLVDVDGRFWWWAGAIIIGGGITWATSGCDPGDSRIGTELENCYALCTREGACGPPVRYPGKYSKSRREVCVRSVTRFGVTKSWVAAPGSTWLSNNDCDASCSPWWNVLITHVY
jgi:RHS repeat-associated protein